MGTEKRERQKTNRQARLEELQRQQRKAKNRKLVLRWTLIVVLAGAAIYGISLYVNRDDGNTATSTTTLGTAGTTTTIVTGNTFAYGTGACPPTDGSATRTTTFTDAPQKCIDPNKTYKAQFDTSEGKVEVQLDTTLTPGTVNNFVTLARWKYYDGTSIFRTDTSIDIIQGGGKTNTDSPGYTIPDEGGTFTWTDSGGKGPFTYQAGDLVMARAGSPDSGGGQWFFGVGPNVANLDSQGTYVTFGKVTQGLDVLQKILGLNVDDPSSGLGGAPSPAVTVNSVTITES